MFYRLYSFPKPIIAAVNGAAIAGGCGIATLADFTLAVPEAKFGYTEVKIGFIPALVSVFLRRQIGEKHARDLCSPGESSTRPKRFAWAWSPKSCPAETLDGRAHAKLPASCLAASPTSIARTKRLAAHFDEAAIRAELEIAIEANADIRSTADFREGLPRFSKSARPNGPAAWPHPLMKEYRRNHHSRPLRRNRSDGRRLLRKLFHLVRDRARRAVPPARIRI